MGSLDRPHRETCVRDFGLYPWRAFCMKKIINQIKLFIGTILFFALWPIIILILWIKALFSNKKEMTNEKKVPITQEVVILIGIAILAYVFL